MAEGNAESLRRRTELHMLTSMSELRGGYNIKKILEYKEG